MKHFKFASLSHPAKYGYAYSTETWSSSSETCGYFRQFETYGDGLIQHSSDWSVTFDFLTDYCASLAEAMLTNPDLVRAVGSAFRADVDEEIIPFAASVVFNEEKDAWHSSKRRFVSIGLRKIATAKVAEHDKRYVELNKYMDGSLASIMRLICDEYTNGLTRYLRSEAVRIWGGNQKHRPSFGEGWNEYFGGDWQKKNALRLAVTACRSLVEAADKRSSAEDALTSYKQNIERAAESARVASEAAEVA